MESEAGKEALHKGKPQSDWMGKRIFGRRRLGFPRITVWEESEANDSGSTALKRMKRKRPVRTPSRDYGEMPDPSG